MMIEWLKRNRNLLLTISKKVEVNPYSFSLTVKYWINWNFSFVVVVDVQIFFHYVIIIYLLEKKQNKTKQKKNTHATKVKKIKQIIQRWPL